MTPDASPDSPSRFSVLLICRANVCRSPTAELLLRRGLTAASMSDLVDVSSAGVSVVSGLPWCRAAAALVDDGPDRTALLRSHRARDITEEMVEGADLVLAASREQRAAVVRLVPHARVRVFTLNEAAMLAGAVAARMGHHLAAPVVVGGPAPEPPAEGSWESTFALSDVPVDATPRERLRWLTVEMHNARGLVPVPPLAADRTSPPKRWWPWRRAEAVEEPEWTHLDIPDPHGPMPARHRVDQLQAAVATWSTVAGLTVLGAAEGSEPV